MTAGATYITAPTLKKEEDGNMGIYINIHIYIHVHIYRYSYRRPHGEELRGVHSSRGNVHNRPSLETGNTRKMGAKYSGGGGEKQKMPTKYEENTAEEL